MSVPHPKGNIQSRSLRLNIINQTQKKFGSNSKLDGSQVSEAPHYWEKQLIGDI